MFSAVKICPNLAYAPQSFCNCWWIAWTSLSSCASSWPRYLNTSTLSRTVPFSPVPTVNSRRSASAEATAASRCVFCCTPISHACNFSCQLTDAIVHCIWQFGHRGRLLPLEWIITLSNGCRSRKCRCMFQLSFNSPRQYLMGQCIFPPKTGIATL